MHVATFLSTFVLLSLPDVLFQTLQVKWGVRVPARSNARRLSDENNGFMNATIHWHESPLPSYIASDYSKRCDPRYADAGFELNNTDLSRRKDFREHRFASIVGVVKALWQVCKILVALFSVPNFPIPLIGEWKCGAESGDEMADLEDPGLGTLCPELLEKVVVPPGYHIGSDEDPKNKIDFTSEYVQLKLHAPATIAEGVLLPWDTKTQTIIYLAQLLQAMVVVWVDFIIQEPNLFFFFSSWDRFQLTFRPEVWALPFTGFLRLVINFGSAGRLIGAQQFRAKVKWIDYPWGARWANTIFNAVNIFRQRWLPITGVVLVIPYVVSWCLHALPGSLITFIYASYCRKSAAQEPHHDQPNEEPLLPSSSTKSFGKSAPTGKAPSRQTRCRCCTWVMAQARLLFSREAVAAYLGTEAEAVHQDVPAVVAGGVLGMFPTSLVVSMLVHRATYLCPFSRFELLGGLHIHRFQFGSLEWYFMLVLVIAILLSGCLLAVQRCVRGADAFIAVAVHEIWLIRSRRMLMLQADGNHKDHKANKLFRLILRSMGKVSLSRPLRAESMRQSQSSRSLANASAESVREAQSLTSVASASSNRKAAKAREPQSLQAVICQVLSCCVKREDADIHLNVDLEEVEEVLTSPGSHILERVGATKLLKACKVTGKDIMSHFDMKKQEEQEAMMRKEQKEKWCPDPKQEEQEAMTRRYILHEAGYEVQTLIGPAACWIGPLLTDENFRLEQLLATDKDRKQGYNVKELLDAGFSKQELRQAGCKPGELMKADIPGLAFLSCLVLMKAKPAVSEDWFVEQVLDPKDKSAVKLKLRSCLALMKAKPALRSEDWIEDGLLDPKEKLALQLKPELLTSIGSVQLTAAFLLKQGASGSDVLQCCDGSEIEQAMTYGEMLKKVTKDQLRKRGLYRDEMALEDRDKELDKLKKEQQELQEKQKEEQERKDQETELDYKRRMQKLKDDMDANADAKEKAIKAKEDAEKQFEASQAQLEKQRERELQMQKEHENMQRERERLQDDLQNQAVAQKGITKELQASLAKAEEALRKAEMDAEVAAEKAREAKARSDKEVQDAGERAKREMEEVVQALVQPLGGVSLVDNHGASILVQQASAGNVCAVQALLVARADVESKDQGGTGQTALHKAAMLNDLHAIRTLVNWHADLNAKDLEGRTALHLAITAETFPDPDAFPAASALYLLSLRADPDIKDNKKDSALSILQAKAKKGESQNAEVLEKLMANDIYRSSFRVHVREKTAENEAELFNACVGKLSHEEKGSKDKVEFCHFRAPRMAMRTMFLAQVANRRGQVLLRGAVPWPPQGSADGDYPFTLKYIILEDPEVTAQLSDAELAVIRRRPWRPRLRASALDSMPLDAVADTAAHKQQLPAECLSQEIITVIKDTNTPYLSYRYALCFCSQSLSTLSQNPDWANEVRKRASGFDLLVVLTLVPSAGQLNDPEVTAAGRGDKEQLAQVSDAVPPDAVADTAGHEQTATRELLFYSNSVDCGVAKRAAAKFAEDTAQSLSLERIASAELWGLRAYRIGTRKHSAPADDTEMVKQCLDGFFAPESAASAAMSEEQSAPPGDMVSLESQASGIGSSAAVA